MGKAAEGIEGVNYVRAFLEDDRKPVSGGRTPQNPGFAEP